MEMDTREKKKRRKQQAFVCYSSVLSLNLRNFVLSPLSQKCQAATVSPSECWKMTLLRVFESSVLTQSQINTIILGWSPCWKLPENNAAQKSSLNPTRPIDGVPELCMAFWYNTSAHPGDLTPFFSEMTRIHSLVFTSFLYLKSSVFEMHEAFVTLINIHLCKTNLSGHLDLLQPREH